MLNVCHEEKSVMIPNTHTGVPTNVMTMIVTMVLEYLPMNLSQDMKQQKRLPQYTVKLYMSHLLIGLSQMHKCGIMHRCASSPSARDVLRACYRVHGFSHRWPVYTGQRQIPDPDSGGEPAGCRDLKPENLLVDTARRVLKIADLGMARKHEPGRTFTHEVVTQNYRPPEVLLGDGRYDCSVDMWSVGCIFAEMAENQPLFGLKVLSEKRQLDDIFRLRGTPTEHTWPGVTALGGWHARDQWSVVPLADRCPHLGADGLDLLERLLSLNPAMRLDALTALHHPYFDEVAHTRRPHEVAVLPPRHESHPATPSPQPIRKSTL
jgi:serine/threonine protein kinase